MTQGEKPCPVQLTCCQGHFKPRCADHMQVRIGMTTAVCPDFHRIGENTDSSLLGVEWGPRVRVCNLNNVVAAKLAHEARSELVVISHDYLKLL